MIKLERIRREKKWSISEVARRANMGATDVGKIESGRLKPYDSQLKKIASALGVEEHDAASLLEVEVIENPTMMKI